MIYVTGPDTDAEWIGVTTEMTTEMTTEISTERTTAFSVTDLTGKTGKLTLHHTCRF